MQGQVQGMHLRKGSEEALCMQDSMVFDMEMEEEFSEQDELSEQDEPEEMGQTANGEPYFFGMDLYGD